MSFQWDAWKYKQGRDFENWKIGDCGTVSALACAVLGQVGIEAKQRIAWATMDGATDPITENSCKTQIVGTYNYNGQMIPIKMAYDGNNFEAFFTIVDTGVTKAYTVYPPCSEPIIGDRLYYRVLRSVTAHTFWAFNGDQIIGGNRFKGGDPFSDLMGTTGWPGYDLPEI